MIRHVAACRCHKMDVVAGLVDSSPRPDSQRLFPGRDLGLCSGISFEAQVLIWKLYSDYKRCRVNSCSLPVIPVSTELYPNHTLRVHCLIWLPSSATHHMLLFVCLLPCLWVSLHVFVFDCFWLSFCSLLLALLSGCWHPSLQLFTLALSFSIVWHNSVIFQLAYLAWYHITCPGQMFVYGTKVFYIPWIFIECVGGLSWEPKGGIWVQRDSVLLVAWESPIVRFIHQTFSVLFFGSPSQTHKHHRIVGRDQLGHLVQSPACSRKSS